MSGKENTNDDAFVAFVQLRGLQRFTGQHGWVQMQASSKDNFDKLLRSTLAELHRNEVLDESQLLDISCLDCRVSHYPTKETNVTVDIASAIFLVHANGCHYLHLSVPSDIQEPPEEDQSMKEPEQRDGSNPIDLDSVTIQNNPQQMSLLFLVVNDVFA